MASYQELQQSIMSGEGNKAREIISALLQNGKSPDDIITDGLIKGMAIVGQNWKSGQMFIPEVLMSADIVNEGMELLKPLMVSRDLSNIYVGKFVIGTVQGDVHNIGKNLVGVILQSGGFEVIDLGVDVSPDRFIEVVRREQPDILGLSALLTSTMPRMQDVIKALKQSKLRDRVRVMIGGAPINQEFADSIGADAYAADAISALEKAKKLIA